MKTELTAARLRELLHYDPDTGVFTNRVDRGNLRRGAAVGSSTSKGYLRAMVLGQSYRCHRLAWLYMTGRWPDEQIDHINGIRTDNRFCNLRDVGPKANRENTHHACSASGILGVRAWRKKFQATIKVDGRPILLGTYLSAEMAQAAYLEAKRIHHAGFVG